MKDPRGRKSKKHDPVDATFDEVLGAIAESDYKDEETIEKENNAKT